MSWTGREFAAALVIGVVSLPCVAAGPASASQLPHELTMEDAAAIDNPVTTSAARFQERLLQVDINQQQLEETVLVLEDKSAMLYLSGQDLQRWRLRPPPANAAIAYQGEQYFPLSAISGLSHVYDAQQLTLMITLHSDAFVKTLQATQYALIPAATKPGPGGFFNYDLLAAHYPDSTQLSGQFELGYFNRSGVGTSNILAEQLGSHHRLTRLDSTWTIDFPEKLQTVRIGDAVTAPGTWGRSLLFGGIQYGSNFATKPGFLAFPPQIATGQAVLPSTVDVFVNNALVTRQSVPPGPFSISNLPVITGAGEVQLVVRDLLGREEIVSRPFYGSQALLAKGLASFSCEFGFVRENFGINSNDYGNWLGTGTYRRGISEVFTAEAHGEAMRDQATFGAGGDYLLPHFGTFSGYLAGSQGNAGKGAMMLLGIERQARPWSFAARTQWATSAFTLLGQQASQLSPIQASSANISYAAGASGSIGIAYVTQHNRDQADVRIATVSYSVALGRIASFSVSAMRSLIGDANTTIFANMSIPLDAATSMSLSSQSMRGGRDGNSSDVNATLQRNLPLGEGYGYRLQARSNRGIEASYTLQNNVGRYTVAAAQNQGATSVRVNVSGGVAVVGGGVFMSRRIDQSFAVSRIPDFRHVRLLVDNQPAGITDDQGNALIPRLRAYDRNVISVDQRDLPMNAKIDALSVVAVPTFRSGIEVIFPIGRANGATLTIHLEDGTPLPVGAAVLIVGRDEIHPVGYDGQVYVDGLAPSNTLRASWPNNNCEFAVRYGASNDPLPDLGVFTCIKENREGPE